MKAAVDVICMGEALWDLEAPPGVPLTRARSLRLSAGGAAVNSALALAKLGLSTSLAAVVGADALGEALLARVAAGGVNVALAERGPDRTGIVFIERAQGGTRVVGYRREDEPAPDLAEPWKARALLLTGVLPSADHAARFADAAQAARRRGALVALDLNARPRPWRGRAARVIEAVIAAAGVVKASDDDLAALSLRERDLRGLMRDDAVLVLTAGGEPARAIGPFGEVLRAPRAVEAASAMGAGDAFTAGLVAALLGDEARDAVFWDGALRRAHTLARRRVKTKKRSACSTVGGEPSQGASTK